MSVLSWITGLGGLASGVANSFLQNSQSNKALKAQQEENEKNRQYNAAQAQLAYQRSVQQWHRENQYNSPSSVMARYRNAGLNPDLMASNGDTGSMATFSGSSAASYSGGVTPQPPTDWNQGFKNLMEARLLEAQAKNLDADTRGKQAQADILETDAKFEEALKNNELKTSELDITLKSTDIDWKKEDISRLRLTCKEIEQNLQNLKATYNESVQRLEGLKEDVISKRLDNLFKEQSNEVLLEQLSVNLQISKKEAETYMTRFLMDIAHKQSEINVNNARVSEILTSTANAVTSGRLLSLQLGEEEEYQSHFKTLDNDGNITQRSLTAIRNVLKLGGSLINGLFKL
ncbi:DNA pilot protein [Peromfec virus RodF8_14]|uniref:DNA pilot protein n=1 Tax=Peromfec virus RodF8_14 TaxID=2929359 RepID=A0A976N363_9VIRU|nr:DNA pilot protein [Peromfec virus RodF8_14]